MLKAGPSNSVFTKQFKGQITDWNIEVYFSCYQNKMVRIELMQYDTFPYRGRGGGGAYTQS